MSMRIIYQNARSLKTINRDNNEIHNLKQFLSTDKPDFLLITETWLDNNILDQELQAPNYDFFRKDRGTRGGGIIMYHNNNIQCVRRSDLETDTDGFNEILICEEHAKPHNFFMILLYRPPNASVLFNNNLSEVLLKTPDYPWIYYSTTS